MYCPRPVPVAFQLRKRLYQHTGTSPLHTKPRPCVCVRGGGPITAAVSLREAHVIIAVIIINDHEIPLPPPIGTPRKYSHTLLLLTEPCAVELDAEHDFCFS